MDAATPSPALCYDIIGDVHGQMDKMAALLQKMGYQPHGDGFSAPVGHRALFLGDIIDPKPGYESPGGVRATLRTVKAMCDSGNALCLMGNHEFHAILYHTRGPDGQWLRSHGERSKRTHQGTLNDFPDHMDPDGEWHRMWMPWLKQLPFYLDLGAFRAVHACWHPPSIHLLEGKSLLDNDFLLTAADHRSEEGVALNILLKGVEILLPEGVYAVDQMGVKRGRIRTRWWHAPEEGATFRELIFPTDPTIPHEEIPHERRHAIPGYGHEEPPVFFGHYLKPAEAPFLSEKHNVACLDHGASMGGPLICYRWKGESHLIPEHFMPHL